MSSSASTSPRLSFHFSASASTFSCDKQRGISAANCFPAINNADYRRRTPRHDYSIMFVQRKAPRRDYSLMFVQRRAPRHDYSIMFVQRRAPRRHTYLVFVRRRTVRRHTFLVLVHRRTIRRQPFRDLVHRRTVCRQPFLDLVRRRTVRRQSFSILSIGELFAGNLFRFSPSANCSPPYISYVCPSANYSPATLRHGATREMVGAAPVCPPERPRSGVSIRKGHVPRRKGRVSMRRNVCALRMMHTCYR